MKKDAENTTEQGNEANTMLVAVTDMLQYSETSYVIDCPLCGAQNWFDLPQSGDKSECIACECIMVVSDCN